jgi:hypothetical protein
MSLELVEKAMDMALETTADIKKAIVEATKSVE